MKEETSLYEVKVVRALIKHWMNTERALSQPRELITIIHTLGLVSSKIADVLERSHLSESELPGDPSSSASRERSVDQN
jgi:hypothetical protein